MKEIIGAPRLDILARGPLHRVMLLLIKPATWPLAAVVVVAVGMVAAAWMGWKLAVNDNSVPWLAAGILGGVMVGDGLLFAALPRLSLSFGESKAHWLFLGGLRLIAAWTFALLALFLALDVVLPLYLGTQLAGTLLLAWGTVIEPFRLKASHLTIETGKLREPVRALHITDLHVERLTHRESRLLLLAEQLNPDIILMTGDYLNLSYVEDDTARTEVRRLFGELNAPDGVYATLGTPQIDRRSLAESLFAGTNIKLLRNEICQVTLGDGRQLAIVGMDCTHDLPYDSEILRELAGRLPADMPAILLYHSPDLMPVASQWSFDLYLAGHTHGGQVRLPLWGAILTSSVHGKRYEMGHYLENGLNLYVSRGIGMEGLSMPRLRFLCPPEITLVELR